ncbi:MAG TPA: LuxR family transcriptional regulator, partial [Gammaproteobacteria bacterium]|nr:LuxR family transcriptional regulator [Gammaproteobacteria bacterium]
MTTARPSPTLDALEAWHQALAQAFIHVDETSFLEHLASALCTLTPIE